MTSNRNSVVPSRTLNIWRRHTLALGLSSLLFVQPVFALGAPFPELPRFAAIPPAPEVPGSSSSLGPLPDAPLPESEGLTIEILDGEGALNNIRQRTAREPIVQVEDKNHKPVAGALVLFAIQSGPGGASGSVAGATSFSVRTGADGKAQLKGLKPNNLAGEFTITVTASVGVMIATVIIHQRNESGVGAGNTTSTTASTASTTGEVVRKNHHYLLKGSIIGGVAVTGLVIGLVVSQKSGGATITAGNGTVTPP
jgi:hypothetical protein